MKDQFEWLNMLPVVMFTDPEPSSPEETALGCLGLIIATAITIFLFTINPWLPILGWGGLLLVTFVLALPAIREDLRPPQPLTYHEPRRPTVADIQEKSTTARRQVHSASQEYLNIMDQLLHDE
jgi:hypothetical protein